MNLFDTYTINQIHIVITRNSKSKSEEINIDVFSSQNHFSPLNIFVSGIRSLVIMFMQDLLS